MGSSAGAHGGARPVRSRMHLPDSWQPCCTAALLHPAPSMPCARSHAERRVSASRVAMSFLKIACLLGRSCTGSLSWDGHKPTIQRFCDTVVTHLSNCDQSSLIPDVQASTEFCLLGVPCSSVPGTAVQLAADLLLSTVGGTVAVGPTASSSCNDSRAVLRVRGYSPNS
jgi:hypothetical protein